MQYLSDEWIEAASAALSQDGSLRDATADAEVTIQYEVTGAPGGKRTYAVVVDHGSVSMEPGGHPEAQVTFTLDYDTAAAIARGERSAQVAFMTGEIKLGGDMTWLIRQHDLFGELVDALAEVRASTTF